MRLFGRLVYDIAVSGAVETGEQREIDFFGATESSILPTNTVETKGAPSVGRSSTCSLKEDAALKGHP